MEKGDSYEKKIVCGSMDLCFPAGGERTLNNTEINDNGSDIGFVFGDATIVFEDGKNHVYKNKMIIAEYDIKEFSRAPNAIFRNICKSFVLPFCI